MKLKFDCGAEYPLTESYNERGKKEGFHKRKDGRYRILVVSPNAKSPTMPDGKSSPCFDCPCKKSSGRRAERGFLEGEKPSGGYFDRGHFFITCYPQEMNE